MKKFINVLAVMLALVMCLGVVVACANDDEGAADGTTPATTTKAPVNTTTATQTTTTAEVTTTDKDSDKVTTPEVDVPADGMITSAAQLHAVLCNGAADGTYTVNAEKLDMGKYKWTGMVKFSGTFDFGGCTIENASYSLFISVVGGTIKNLKIANSTFAYTDDDAQADLSAADNTTQGNIYYSPVVRYADGITIQNVTLESTVTVTSDIYTDNSCHGGVVGSAVGSNIRIENCHFKGTYTTDSTIVRVGGIVGGIVSSDVSTINVDSPEESTALVINCSNSGKIENLGVGSDSKTGGVVGYMANAVAVKCANYGEIVSADNGQTSGVVAYVGNNDILKDCLNAGSVTGAQFPGGVTGYSNAKGNMRTFINCVNIGSVTHSGNGNNDGGILGVIGNSDVKEILTNCFNLKTVCDTYSWSNETGADINPADPATFGKVTVTDCGNLESIDAILTAMEAVNPGVFVKNGDSIKLAD